MFGLKLKSWMEAHLGRPRHKSTSHQNQKRAPKDSSAVAASTTTPSFASSSGVGTSSCSASASSTTNSTSSSLNTSSSIGSTTTAIVGGGGISISSTSNNLTGNIASNSNPTVLDHLSSHHSDSQEANSNFQARSDFFSSVTTSSSTVVVSSAAIIGGGGGQVVGSDSVTVSAEGQLHRPEKSSNCVPPQKRDAIGTRVTELGSHAPNTHQLPEHPGESDHPHHQQPISSTNATATTAVTGSVSNSTSILSGSFCNNLSSPDTGYSTDGYSPKSVYPALSFDSSGKSTTTSKSSYTISSLVSSELHSSKQTSLSSASCSVQNGLDEFASPSPSSPALTSSTPFSHSSSSGISSSTSDSSCFPKGESSLRLIQQKQQQHSIPEDDTEKQQVIMGDDPGPKTVFPEQDKKKSLEKPLHHHQVELQQKKQQQQQQKSGSKTDISISSPSSTIDPLPKFAPINIDFEKQDFNNHNGRTHRRAESMDARTPSQEDYKPLVQDDEESGSGGNPSLVMTAAQAKSIRTSYIINSSGQIVEFSSYKNAYSICSPRRERTRIKTNPWIILSNNKTGNTSDNNSHANPSAAAVPAAKSELEKNQKDISTCAPSKTLIPPLESSSSSIITQKVGARKQELHKESIQQTVKVMGESANAAADVGVADYKGGKSNHTTAIDPCRKLNLEINNRQEEPDQEDEEEHFEDETGIMDHDSSSSLLYRISTSASASDSGKGTLEPGTNRNSTESSCLLSDSTASTRNSIISHEAERSSSRSGRSSSGESISSSLHHHHHRDHHPVDDDTVGHASPTSSSNNTPALLFTESQKQHQQQHIHQCATATVNSNNSVVSKVIPKKPSEERTFRNAAVATDLLSCETSFPKSASVSVGVGTTSSNKSSKFAPIIMVDKETDILSDWANTDEDGDEEIETDRNDNETVTPAPSSPGTDVDRAFFSQSTSSATDIDFGDSSAATAASSTAVFPPSSLIRQQRYNKNNSCTKNSRESGGNGSARFHNESTITPSNGFNGGGGSGDVASQILPGTYDHHHHHNINMNLSTTCYPSVPIIRPVLAAVSQHHGPNGIPDSYAYDIAGGGPVLLNHAGELVNHPFIPPSDAAMCFASGGGVPNFNLDDEGDYPEMKETHHHKGIARGALGFLRKIFKKGACSSQRHSPDSTKGKKSRGKSDNNLAAVGLGSPLLTISEPLCNPRYSAVLTTKKQMNPALTGYFLTPTPNSFRRRSGTGTDSSDSKGSKPHTKSVKTDIIRLPQGPLSPQQQQQSVHQQQRQTHVQSTSSSHSSGSSSSNGVSNGIPQSCSTFLSPCGGAPGTINFHQLNLPGAGSLHANQSNTNTNTNSTSSSIHSLMSTSTSAASVSGNGNQNRPPSQNQSKTPIPSGPDNYYVNSSPTVSRQSPFISGARGNSHSMSPPPPLISEHSPYLNGIKNQQQHSSFQSQSQVLQSQQHRRDPHSQSQPPIKGILPYESSPRLPNTSAASAAQAAAAAAVAAAAARMNSPSFNNYSPIHRLVVTGGSHLLNRSNPNCPSNNPSAVNPATGGLMQYPPSGESPLPMPRHGANGCGANNGNGTGNNNNNPAGFVTNSQIINRPTHPTSSASPLINHRYPTTSSPHPHHPYPSPMSSSHIQQQQHNQHHQQNVPSTSVGHHFFASPSPILRNPRYQYIASSNQNSPILNVSKRMNTISSSHIIQPNGNGPASNPSGPPPLLTTFSPLPSSSSSAAALVAPPRESLINNNSFLSKTNTITGSPNLNSSDPFNQRARQVVSTSVSYNEFENLAKNYHLHNNGNNILPLSSATPHNQYNHPHHHHILSHPAQQQQQPQHQHPILHQSHQAKIHQNHYYSSPIVKELQQHPDSLKQTFWNNTQLFNNSQPTGNEARHQQRMNQNLRFNSFLVRHRQLPQFYHTQWGLQERIYETVDSEDEQTPSDEVSASGGVDYDQDGNEIDRISELSLPVEVHHRRMKHCYSREMEEEPSQQNCDGGFHLGRESRSNHANKEFVVDGQTNGMMSYTGGGEEECAENAENFHQTSKSKSRRSKPKSLSASGRPLPRPVVALPMMPGTYLSETETRLLEADNETDRKYKRLINEAEALLKEISVEKSKRGGGTQDNAFRLEGCPQSDPLRRKAYDCWALRRLQQELAGCCASPPVLHRSRLNLQSPSTPGSNNPYLSHFQNMGAPPLPSQVPYMSSSGVDGNQNTFEL